MCCTSRISLRERDGGVDARPCARIPRPGRSDVRRELRDRLGIDAAELALWDDVSRRLRVVFDADGVIGQFEGFDALAELDLDRLRLTAAPSNAASVAVRCAGTTAGSPRALRSASPGRVTPPTEML